MTTSRRVAAGAATVGAAGVLLFVGASAGSSAGAAPQPSPSPTGPSVVVQAYPTPAWWSTVRALQIVTVDSVSYNPCIADAELLPEGISVRKQAPLNLPQYNPSLIPWERIRQVEGLNAVQADYYGCP